ncbi:glycosyltransferase [Mucilaginibacter sp. UR6-11]|uniref:glycosyltransferase n=1 Tax=Mucilaginibacter sp. UR6-11 TaxID=1435644 RepID=UPI001E490AC5|nr:glycosyltransferase [Mucilaginibacter sp. UR6-11]MCC8425268.1 glycosyltransferase [Mucilaginibacter sp. UR6-11]
MDSGYTLCIIKPNKSSFSETFVQAHIDLLAGNKLVLYGGAFPVYDNEDKPLIKSKWGLLSYLFQKKVLKRKRIAVRTNALKCYLVEKHVDAVFAEYGMVGAMVTQACKQANVPLVIHYHGADVYNRSTVSEYKDLYRDAFNYASAFISVSADMVEKLKEMGAPADKIYNASCGVDTEDFPLADISNSPRNFLAIGRFVEKKSPSSVVKAFKIVADKFPDAKLWMVGDGPLFEETKKLVGNLNLQSQVTLAGVLNKTQIKELIKNMRAYVQHSVTAADGDREGTPVSVLEASSSGLPVVSTRHAGIKEAVIDGVTGFLTAEHDIDGMAQGMIKLAGSPGLAVKLGKAGRGHIMLNYHIKSRIALLDSIIQKSIK